MITSSKTTGYGILCVLAAFACFSTQDMLFKLLSPHYAIPVVHLIRIFFVVTITLALLLPIEAQRHGMRLSQAARMTKPWAHWLRSFFIFAANLCFFTGLAINDIGVHVAIFFIAPLLLTGLSVVFLAERVGWRRWSAVAVGLAGAMMIVKPTPDAFNPYLLLPLAAACFHAATQLTTRVLGTSGDSTAVISASAQMVWILMGFVLFALWSQGQWSPQSSDHPFYALLRAWEWPGGIHIAILAAIVVLSTSGGFLVSQGYRMIPASTAAQYEYVALPLGVFWGMVIWAERPDLLTWIGMALIGGAGLYVFYRERIRRQAT